MAFKGIAGWRYAGDVTLLLHAVAGILATYGLGRAGGLSRPWSALCAAAVALSPLYVFMSLQAMSDVPSLAWTTLAVLASLRARERPSWAIAAGAALAVDVLLRPANVLAFLPVLVALGASPRRWLYMVLGGLPGAVVFFAENASAYGGLATTGYGGGQPGLLRCGPRPRHARPVSAMDAGPLHAGHSPLPRPSFPMASVPRRMRMLLVLWIVAIAAFYSAYRYTHESWWSPCASSLPMAPALVVGSAYAAGGPFAAPSADPGTAHSPVRLSSQRSALSWRARLWCWCNDLSALNIGAEELRYGLLADWMRANMPTDAVCLSMQTSGSIYFYTPFTIVRWDMLKGADVPKMKAALETMKRPLYMILFPFEFERDGLARAPVWGARGTPWERWLMS